MKKRLKDIKKGALFRLIPVSPVVWRKEQYSRSWKRWRCVDMEDETHVRLFETDTWVYEVTYD